jgi:membrane protease YdiL (CAAX protease family)
VVVAELRGYHLEARQLETNGFLLAITTCLTTPVALGLVWYLTVLRRGMPSLDYLAWRRVRLKTLSGWCGAILLFILVSDTLTASTGHPIVPEFMGKVYTTANWPPLLWLALIVAAPCGEEFVFRGFWFQGFLQSRLHASGTILLTSLAWAAIHMQYDLYGRLTIFATGLLLGYARFRSHSIIPPLFMHALMNLVAILQIVAELSQPGSLR